MRRAYFSSTRTLHVMPTCAGEAALEAYVNNSVIDFMEKNHAICGRCSWALMNEARRRRDANRDRDRASDEV